MRFVVLDLETYFADDYTLSRMTTEAYIRHPRFQAHGAAIKWSKDHAAKWYDEPALRYVLSQEDWSDVLLIHHHAHFDGLILSHHYGVCPAMYGCTLSMARLLLGNHISVSLDSVRAQFGIPSKKTPYNLFRGKHWDELDLATRTLLAEGCADEVESIWKIFGMLSRGDYNAEG
jgi:DNA polymerase III epsilon subunit-like protein